MRAGFSDFQSSDNRAPYPEGLVPDAMFPGRYWLRGVLIDKPIWADTGAFYSAEDVDQTWLYFHNVFNYLPLDRRANYAKPGATFWAKDTDQVFVWVE
jgi:hypothetical protein